MDRKYELTNETIKVNGHILYRIRAVRDFGDVKSGDLGGFVETGDNLFHNNNCWIYDNAMAYGDAKVLYNAKVYENAQVYENAWITECGCIGGNSRIYDNAMISGNAYISGSAQICKDSHISDGIRIYGNAYICINTRISKDSCIWGNASINSGMWNRVLKVCEGRYLISSTLQKILLGWSVSWIKNMN